MIPRTFTITTFPAPRLLPTAREGGNAAGDVGWPVKGRRRELSLDQLAELLTRPVAGAGKYLIPLYVGGALEGDKRGARMQRVSVLSVDVENGATIEEACAALDCAHILYTSWRHKPEAQRFRVVIPLAQDIDAAEYVRLWQWAAARLRGADAQASDPTRSSFLPGQSPGGYFRYIVETSLPLLDPSTVAAPSSATRAATSSSPERGARLDPATVLRGVPEGGRDGALFRYACSLRARGVDRAEAEALVTQAAAACAPAFDRGLALAKVDRVWRVYAGAPLEDVEEALSGLQQLVEATQQAKGRADRARLAARALEDQAGLIALALAWRARREAVEGLLGELGAVHGLGQQARALRAAVIRVARAQGLGPADEEGPKHSVQAALASLLTEHPLPEGLKVPKGFRLSDSGIAERDPEGEKLRWIAQSPILVTGRLQDLTTGAVLLRLEWVRGGVWAHRIVPREHALDARALMALAKWGAPVNSDNSRALVRFLSAFEEANWEVLPMARTSAAMGWQGEKGRLGFLWGRTWLHDGDAAHAHVDNLSPTEWQHDAVHLVADEGFEGVVDAYRAEGTWTGWLRALGDAVGRPSVLLGLYAGLLPPLLRLLDAPNFVIDWSGETSQGKTTTIRVAASCWGAPDEKRGLVHTWDARRPWIEGVAGMTADLPFCLDDTKRAQDRPLDISQTIFDMAQGRGRGRGTPTGIQRSRVFNTVLLSTGEQPVTAFGQDGGARARVLSLWGSPWGEKTERSADEVRTFTSQLFEHHGHAGPRLVLWLIKHRAVWGELKADYRAKVQKWTALARGNPVASRAAEYVAALELVAELAHDVLQVPRPTSNPIGLAWEAAMRAGQEADRARDALDDVLAWCTANQNRFFGRASGMQPQSWLGRWEGDAAWMELAILAPELRRFLKGEGFEPHAVFKSWRDRQWLVPGDGAHLGPKRTVAGVSQRCVVLQRRAFEASPGD